jgi:hypothetical protein
MDIGNVSVESRFTDVLGRCFGVYAVARSLPSPFGCRSEEIGSSAPE